jgi:type IV pilus assembly protein PilN
MRLRINLASQPYEVAQQYKQRLTLLIAILGVAAVALVGYIGYPRAHSRSINRQLTLVQRQISQLELEEAQARAMLGKPSNRDIAEQSDFLNELFARKALSWTRIFSEMERIVPPSLHVVSMKPEYTKANDLVLHVVVATDSRDRAVELVRRMEKSNHFRQSQIVAEAVLSNTSDQSGTGNIQFDIAAIYVPTGADSEETPAADANGGKTVVPVSPPPVARKIASIPGGPNRGAAADANAPNALPSVNAAQTRPSPGRSRAD